MVGLLAFGCDDGRTDAQLAWPQGAVGGSALLADLRGTPRVWATDLMPSTQKVEVDLGLDEADRIQALTFDANLAELRLRPGLQALDDVEGRGPLELGTPLGLWALALEDQRASWSKRPLTELLAGFEAQRLARLLPDCSTFAAGLWRQTLDEATSLAGLFIAELDDGRALVGVGRFGSLELGIPTRFGALLYRADRAGLVPIASPLPGTDVTAGYRDPGGDLYLGGQDGSVWRLAGGDLSAAPAKIRMATSESIAAIDGGHDPSGELELVIVDSAARASFYKDGVWSTALQIPAPVENVFSWGAPGLAFARSNTPAVVVRIERTSYAEERADDNSQIMSVRRVPGFGVLAGSDRGQLWGRNETGTWTLLPDNGDPGWWLVAMAGYRDGVVFLLASGTLGEYQMGRGHCEEQTILPFLNTGVIAALGSDILVAGNDRGNVELIYVPVR